MKRLLLLLTTLVPGREPLMSEVRTRSMLPQKEPKVRRFVAVVRWYRGVRRSQAASMLG